MLGSQLLVQSLRRHGVRVIFSLSGNQIMPVYDACIDAGIRIVHVRHEAAAVFMADAWAQVTGETGVALLTAGPGLCNGLAALYASLRAESSVLLLSGDSSVAEDGAGAFQELDQVAMSRPLTRMSRRVLAASALCSAVDEAIGAAASGRPRPVHLALPFDVLTAESGIAELPPIDRGRGAPLPTAADLEELAGLIDRAQRPIIIGGPASARHRPRQALLESGRRMGVPILAMESPRGLRDPSLGSVAREVVRADLIVAAGKAIDFMLAFGRPGTFSDDAAFILLDADAAPLNRGKQLLGSRLLRCWQCDPIQVLTVVSVLRNDWPERTEWTRTVSDAIASRAPAPKMPVAQRATIDTGELCRRIQRFIAATPAPIVVCDGGEFGQWAQAFCTAPIRIINGPSGAIGGALCYAIAAKIARPESTVFALMGDGSSGFHLMEFDTAVRENAPFIAVIGTDNRWNAEYLIQVRNYGANRLIGCELSPTARYEQVACGLGGYGASVERIEDIDRALQLAFDSARPSCINVAISGEAAPVFV